MLHFLVSVILSGSEASFVAMVCLVEGDSASQWMAERCGGRLEEKTKMGFRKEPRGEYPYQINGIPR